MGKLDLAEKSLREAIRLEPDYDDAHYNLAVVYQRQGRVQEAVKCYERVVEIKPDRLEALSNLGGCYVELGDLKGEEFCRRAMAVNPSHSAPYINLGVSIENRVGWRRPWRVFRPR